MPYPGSTSINPTTVPTQNWNYLASTTLNFFGSKQVEDNVFKQFAGLNAFKARMKGYDGGYSILQPVDVEGPVMADIAFFEHYDTITTGTASQGPTIAQYVDRRIAGGVAFSQQELDRNHGEAQFIDFLTFKREQMERGMAKVMNDALYTADGSVGTKAPNSLNEIIKATDPIRGALGGLSQATYANWASYVDNTAKALTIRDISHTYNVCARQGKTCDIILTTAELWESYEAQLLPSLRFMDTSEASGGFDNLLYRRAKMFWDFAAPAGKLYFINLDDIFIRKLNHRWFTWTDGLHEKTTEGIYHKCVAGYELTTKNRQSSALLTART